MKRRTPDQANLEKPPRDRKGERGFSPDRDPEEEGSSGKRLENAQNPVDRDPEEEGSSGKTQR